MPVPGSSAFFASTPSIFAPFASSRSVVPMSGLFLSATPIFGLFVFSGLDVTLTPGRQKLIKLNRKKKSNIRRIGSRFYPFALVQISPPLSDQLYWQKTVIQ